MFCRSYRCMVISLGSTNKKAIVHVCNGALRPKTTHKRLARKGKESELATTSHGAACGGEAVNPRLNPTCALGKKKSYLAICQAECCVGCSVRLKSMGKWLFNMKACPVVSTLLCYPCLTRSLALRNTGQPPRTPRIVDERFAIALGLREGRIRAGHWALTRKRMSNPKGCVRHV
jgi:hypothetical protein